MVRDTGKRLRFHHELDRSVPDTDGSRWTDLYNSEATSASLDSYIRWVSGGPNAEGNSRTRLGYSGSTGDTGGEVAGILSSATVVLYVFNGSGNLTSLYTNGANVGSPVDMTSFGLNLRKGNPNNVPLSYNGSTLAMTAVDTKNKAIFSKHWSIDIPSTVEEIRPT